MTTTHAPTTHPLADGTIAVCCQDAWWCVDCGRLDHLAFDIDPLNDARCWNCVRTADADHANELANAAITDADNREFYGSFDDAS